MGYVDQPVAAVRLVAAATAASEALVEALPALTDPPERTGRVPRNEGVGPDIVDHYRSGSHEGVRTDGRAAHHGGVGADRGPGADQRGYELVQ